MADEVMVMKDCRVVEQGPTAAIFADPKEPYTKALMAAALEGVTLDTGRQERPAEPQTLD